jgi:hypothetical protein
MRIEIWKAENVSLRAMARRLAFSAFQISMRVREAG